MRLLGKTIVCLLALVVEALPLGAQSPDTFADSLGRADLPTAPKFGSSFPRDIHYQITYSELGGHEHTATYEETSWGAHKYKITWHTDGFDLAVLQNDQMRWVSKSGIMPLKLYEFWMMFPKPWLSIGRLAGGSKAVPGVSTISEDGTLLSCADDDRTAKVCFFKERGWFASGAVDGRLVTYQDWKPVGDRYLPMQMMIVRNGKEVLHAYGTVEKAAPNEDLNLLIPSGASSEDTSVSSSNGAPAIVVQRENAIQIVYRSVWRDPTGEVGTVLLSVVPRKDGKAGDVKVLDADSPQLTKMCVEMAKSLVFAGSDVKAGTVIPVYMNVSMDTRHTEIIYYPPAWLF